MTRLAFASALLNAPRSAGGWGRRLPDGRDPERILAAIDDLAAADKQRLKDLVDWVEEYEGAPQAARPWHVAAPRTPTVMHGPEQPSGSPASDEDAVLQALASIEDSMPEITRKRERSERATP